MTNIVPDASIFPSSVLLRFIVATVPMWFIVKLACSKYCKRRNIRYDPVDLRISHYFALFAETHKFKINFKVSTLFLKSKKIKDI